MSKEDIPSQAKFYGLGRSELRILELILYWFHGHTLTINGEERSIATHHEPDLAALFDASPEQYDDRYRYAHQRLLDGGFLQEMYICRRKIDWAPTEQYLRAVRDCFKQVAGFDEKHRPSWASDDAEGPIFGDPNALLYHRKGVELAGHILPKMAWAFDIRSGRTYGIEWYPDGGRSPAPDLFVKTNDHMVNIGVEAITKTGNRDHQVNKWEFFTKQNWITWWITDGRSTTCSFLNELHDRGLITLDRGRFSSPYDNWSSDAINRKLWNSENNYTSRGAGDVCHTVTGLLEGDTDKVQDLFEEFHSNN